MGGLGRGAAVVMAIGVLAACSNDGEASGGGGFCDAVRAHTELKALGTVHVTQATPGAEVEVRRRLARFTARTAEVDEDLRRLAPAEVEADMRMVTEYELAYVAALRAADYDLGALVLNADGARLRQLAPAARDAASRIDAVTQRDCDAGFETVGEDIAAAPIGPDAPPDRPAPAAPPEPDGPLPTGPTDPGPGPGTEGPADPPPPPAPAEPDA